MRPQESPFDVSLPLGLVGFSECTPTCSRLVALRRAGSRRALVRGSGWKAGAAKSKKALGALLPIVPKQLQRQYRQSSLAPFGINQGRLSAATAVSRCTTIVRRARPSRFRQWFGPGEAAAQSGPCAARSPTAVAAPYLRRGGPRSRCA